MLQLPTDLSLKILRLVETKDRQAVGQTCREGRKAAELSFDACERALRSAWLHFTGDFPTSGPISQGAASVADGIAARIRGRTDLSQDVDARERAEILYETTRAYLGTLRLAFPEPSLLAQPENDTDCRKLMGLMSWQLVSEMSETLVPLLYPHPETDAMVERTREQAPRAPFRGLCPPPGPVSYGICGGANPVTFLELYAEEFQGRRGEPMSAYRKTGVQVQIRMMGGAETRPEGKSLVFLTFYQGGWRYAESGALGMATEKVDEMAVELLSGGRFKALGRCTSLSRQTGPTCWDLRLPTSKIGVVPARGMPVNELDLRGPQKHGGFLSLLQTISACSVCSDPKTI